MKPLLIYDGDCNFCRRWIIRWKSLTGDRVDYAPYQTVADQFPQIPFEKFLASVQLVETDRTIYGGAEAVFRTLSYAKGRRWQLWLYKKIPGFAFFTEWFYRLIARHRIFFSKLTRILGSD